MLDNENRPAGNGANSRTTGCTQYIAALRRRRAAAQRTPVLDDGHADPWHYPPITAGYCDAAQHLLERGMTPAPNVSAMREMWKRGGVERDLVQTIAERWDVST